MEDRANHCTQRVLQLRLPLGQYGDLKGSHLTRVGGIAHIKLDPEGLLIWNRISMSRQDIRNEV